MTVTVKEGEEEMTVTVKEGEEEMTVTVKEEIGDLINTRNCEDCKSFFVEQYRCIKAGTGRLKNSFKAIRLLNSHH
ncbi:uncharacterized protein LOC112233733 isoform X2 [Oncorhynchus tshawytscha]|uniref:uncharacterized protein LOC112233733 isoform X2 n=1 Tax=Oncorhynchus tshawytscha TaxID=74940 RepID=UPI001C3D19CF|nr:uncharacterized protein LOC112233733 isoform X2 [Oncorhynchus tshawytscha]